MALKNKTLHQKPITKRPKYELLYCRVTILACRRFSLSPFWGACNRQAACQPTAIGWQAYRVVGKRLALVSKSAGQRIKHIFKALFGLPTKWRDPWDEQ